MSGTLYFVRHGRTLFNERHIIQGWVDSPLTPEGEEQASRVGRYFAQRGVTFDHAYASLVARTHQTLERITDMPFERERGLMEWSFGAFEGERTYLMPAWPWGDFFVPFGGEGQLAFRDRIVSTLTQIMQRTGHRSVLVVSHGSASREFITAVRDGGMADEHMDVPGNCSVARYGVDGEAFRLQEIVEQDAMRRELGE